MRRPVIAGNWKMNLTLKEAQELAASVAKACGASLPVDVLLFPPFVFIPEVLKAVQGSAVRVGAQTMHQEDSGAYTGEISAPMLTSLACSHVVLGHSERRHIFRETDEAIHQKVQAALRHGLAPVLCVGETLAERESGQTFEVVQRQTETGLDQAAALIKNGGTDILVAYEPVWAIGTGKVATPEQAQEVHQFIRKLLQRQLGKEKARDIRILYGGSVKPDNSEALLKQPDIDGALIGGASLMSDGFISIIRTASALVSSAVS